MKLDQLGGLEAFFQVARHQNFRAAAAELQISPSAVSQAIQQLETRLGSRLFQRTTRSVVLTEAGRLFHERARPAYAELVLAGESVSDLTGMVAGTIRVNVPRIGYELVIAPALPKLLEAHPDLSVEIDIDDSFVDIVREGYDAGLRIGEYLEKDMVAVKLGSDFESAIVGSPRYFRKNPPPRSPADLSHHNCINFRYYKDRSVYRWELEEGGKDVVFESRGNLTVSDSGVAVRSAMDGIGIAYVLNAQVEEHLASKRLVRVLEKYSPRFPGFYLYYPSRKHTPAKLRALVEFLKKGN